MTAAPFPPLADELAAALEWWRTAGVDRSFRDEAAGWLSEETPPAAKPAAPKAPAAAPEPAMAAPRIGGAKAAWPANLAEFASWWLTEPSLDTGGATPRVPPRGGAGAELMILVPMPEESDSDRLLAGSHGAFLDAIIAALGVAEDEVYLAAELPRHTPLPDFEALRRGGLDEVTAHHVALVAPQRLLTFGRFVSPFLGHGTTQGTAPTPIFNHEGLRVPILAVGGLDRLLRHAPARETFWRRWLDWTDGDT
jgi:DNA polymerase